MLDVLVATFAVLAAAFALERTLADHVDIDIEAERIAAHSTEWTMPWLWVTGDDLAQSVLVGLLGVKRAHGVR